MAKNKSVNEYVSGVSQGTPLKEISVTDENNNFVFELYKEAQNWLDYAGNLEMVQFMDELIRHSKYKDLYQNFHNIPNPTAIEIYFYLKPIVQSEFLIDSNLFIFYLVMDMLEANLNLVTMHLPVDERIKIEEELEESNVRTVKKRSQKLF
jgi:hypothetical protein